MTDSMVNFFEFDSCSSDFKKVLDESKNNKRLGIHSFHRYYGKLIPAIPQAAIICFSKPEDLIFDPFVGSGTTAIECLRADRDFLGIDINPLSVKISKAKTANYDLDILYKLKERIIFNIENDHEDIKEEEIPFCINRDHWFKMKVQFDLVKIKRNIDKSLDFIEKKEQEKYRNFLFVVLSSVVKQVSNADVSHVFPGISKRMKKLESDGKNKVNTFETFKRFLQKRLNYVKEFGPHKRVANILQGHSSTFDFSSYNNKVDLIITNPPYISSVRYSETLKLELYWMGICKDSNDYFDLGDSMIGNDHIHKADYDKICLTEYDFVNDYIKILYEIDKKQAKVLYEYFYNMDKVIKNMKYVLKKRKKVVMKISDSKIRKVKIPTGKLLTLIALKNGFKLIDFFNDKINNNSRSLTTARNIYSDIIVEDNIITWEKV